MSSTQVVVVTKTKAARQVAKSRRVVTFQTSLEEEEQRTARGNQWRRSKKQRKLDAKMAQTEERTEKMRYLYNLLLNPQDGRFDGRFERAVHESHQILNMDNDTEGYDEDTIISAKFAAQKFVDAWGGFMLVWKFGGQDAGEALNEFRQNYFGMSLEEGLTGSNGKKSGARAASLECLALNGTTKSYTGQWRRDPGDTSSGEDTPCHSAVFRKILRRLGPVVGEIVANHVDETMIMIMPSESPTTRAANQAAIAAETAAAVASVPGGEASINQPPPAAMHTFDFEEGSAGASDNTDNKRKQGENMEWTATANSSASNNPRKKEKGTDDN